MAIWNPVRGSFAGIFAKSLSWTHQWATGRFSTGIPYFLTSGWTLHFLIFSFTSMVATTWLFPIHGKTPSTASRTSWLSWLFLVQVRTPRLYYLRYSLEPVPTLCPFQVLGSELEESKRAQSNLQEKDLEMVDWRAYRRSLDVWGHISRRNWSTKRAQKPHKRPQKSTNDRKFKIGTFRGNLLGRLLDWVNKDRDLKLQNLINWGFSRQFTYNIYLVQKYSKIDEFHPNTGHQYESWNILWWCHAPIFFWEL